LLLLYFVIRAASNSRRVAELSFDAMTPWQQEQVTAARVRRGNRRGEHDPKWIEHRSM
jgi:hypothetical protein